MEGRAFSESTTPATYPATIRAPAVSASAVQRTYPTGKVIVRQREPGVGLYLLIRGRARVQQQSTDGNPQQLMLLGSGEIFDELALLDNVPQSATVVAKEETSELVIPIFDFRSLLHDDADIAIKLLAVLFFALTALARLLERPGLAPWVRIGKPVDKWRHQ